MKANITEEESRYDLRAICRTPKRQWVVGLKGNRAKSFSDSKHGGRHAALLKAIRFRDAHNTKRRPAHITRMNYPGKKFIGWQVRVTISGYTHSRFFADKKHGGKMAALEIAKAFRDQLREMRNQIQA
jgi:hypothetical protein